MSRSTGSERSCTIALQRGRVDVPRRCASAPSTCRRSSRWSCRTCVTSRGTPRTLAPAVLTALASLPWPGNLDELRLALDRLVDRVRSSTIRQEDVIADFRPSPSQARRAGSLGTLRDARLAFEREYIAAVLKEHGWRMSDAARTLGIQRANLYPQDAAARHPSRRTFTSVMTARPTATRAAIVATACLAGATAASAQQPPQRDPRRVDAHPGWALLVEPHAHRHRHRRRFQHLQRGGGARARLHDDDCSAPRHAGARGTGAAVAGELHRIRLLPEALRPALDSLTRPTVAPIWILGGSRRSSQERLPTRASD